MKKRKGQVAVMEYMVLVIMIVFIIFFVIVIIFGFQFLDAGGDYAKGLEERSLFITQNVISSPVIRNLQYRNSVFDDSKLTVMDCDDIKSIFGYAVYMEITTVFDDSPCDGVVYRPDDCIRELERRMSVVCTADNYPDCAVWRFCEDEEPKVFRTLPVNIYRKMNNTMTLGSLKIGVS